MSYFCSCIDKWSENVWFTTVVARYLRPTILLAEHRNCANIGAFVPDARDTCTLVSYRYANCTAEVPYVL